MSTTAKKNQHPVQMAQMAKKKPSPALAVKKNLQGLPRPTCPSLFIPAKVGKKTKLYALPVLGISVEVECNVSTVFATVVATWKNLAKYDADCVFSLPTHGIVTNVEIDITSKKNEKRQMETIVVPNKIVEQLQELMPQEEKRESTILTEVEKQHYAAGHTQDEEEEEEEEELPEGKLPRMDFQRYEPGIFRLPLTNFRSGDRAVVKVTFMEPLKFYEGNYNFHFPFSFNKDMLLGADKFKDINQAIKMNVRINAANSKSVTAWESSTHKCVISKEGSEGNSVHLKVDFNEPLGSLTQAADQVEGQAAEKKASKKLSYDFDLKYNFQQNSILPALIAKSRETEGTDEGHMMLFMTPPKDQSQLEAIPRDFIFLLDKSGSMTGRPFEEATRAVSVALRSLKKDDRFNVIMFDHKYESFVDLKTEAVPLAPASKKNLALAEAWVSRIQPEGGGTDIETPLLASLAALNQAALVEVSSDGTKTRIPFVLLVTDGCVANERAICKEIIKLRKKNKCEPRILTYGIGSYSNWYFLKNLAEIGRGFSDVAIFMEDIYDGMSRLIENAATPVLTNIRIRAEVDDMTLYPFPVPDLFVGYPLNLSANYKGSFPSSIEVVGDQPGDSKESVMEVTAVSDSMIPVEKVFIKQRIDLLSARAWLQESDKIEEEVVELSVENSIPSAYTTLIAFEMTEELKKSLEEEEGKEGEQGPAAAATRLKFNPKELLQNKKAMAAMAGAGVVAVGAVAFSFGDIAATGMNIDMLGEIMQVGDLGCCDCEPGECIECMGSLCPIA